MKVVVCKTCGADNDMDVARQSGWDIGSAMYPMSDREGMFHGLCPKCKNGNTSSLTIGTVHNIQELVSIFETPDAEHYTIDFGKHYGKKVSDVPHTYVQWAIDELMKSGIDARKKTHQHQLPQNKETVAPKVQSNAVDFLSFYEKMLIRKYQKKEE